MKPNDAHKLIIHLVDNDNAFDDKEVPIQEWQSWFTL